MKLKREAPKEASVVPNPLQSCNRTGKSNRVQGPQAVLIGNVTGLSGDSSFARLFGGKFEKSVRVRRAPPDEKFLRRVRFSRDDGFVPRVRDWFC